MDKLEDWRNVSNENWRCTRALLQSAILPRSIRQNIRTISLDNHTYLSLHRVNRF